MAIVDNRENERSPGPRARIAEAQAPSEFGAARKMFEEYAELLGVDLSFQNFESELQALEKMYRPPGGRLLLAHSNGAVVGCVALRRFQADICEMKRLYVRPDARGRGVGRSLAERVIEAAREAGYRRMVLDTLEWLEAARQLYVSLGFREIAPYYDNPIPGVVYMALDIHRGPA